VTKSDEKSKKSDQEDTKVTEKDTKVTEKDPKVAFMGYNFFVLEKYTKQKKAREKKEQ
jgi:hypothetical protein